jgi:ABC-type nitrate/sulfonate/bicarbonate transport system substrate-binding protein
MQWSIAVANDDLLANEPDLVGAVLRGCRRSYRYAAQNRAEWADFGAHYFGIKRETMMKSIERELGDLHFDCEIDLAGMEAAIALQRKLGAVTHPIRLADIVDARFSPAAVSGRACTARVST